MGVEIAVKKGVEAIFKALKDAVHEGQYIVESDDGWGNSSTTPDDVRVILDQFRQEDVESSSFYELIQPTDTKALVPGADLSLPVKSTNKLQVGERTFTIVAFDTDPLKALYTFLLRDT